LRLSLLGEPSIGTVYHPASEKTLTFVVLSLCERLQIGHIRALKTPTNVQQRRGPTLRLSRRSSGLRP
jgi:hypothetical protein